MRLAVRPSIHLFCSRHECAWIRVHVWMRAAHGDREASLFCFLFHRRCGEKRAADCPFSRRVNSRASLPVPSWSVVDLSLPTFAVDQLQAMPASPFELLEAVLPWQWGGRQGMFASADRRDTC
mmetsp:Transcript_26992/g.77542  ORF Transcript_26992/g.77542 Transcript_26992/m.77542 type:complete len:123 (+) Transcript_26992:1174-1542(+)